MHKSLLIFSLLFYCLAFRSQTLLRKASMGILAKKVDRGMQIDSIIPNLSASVLKLKKDDIILSINGQNLKTIENYTQATSLLRTGDPLQIIFLRNSKEMRASGKAIMKPMETSDLADITYDWVKFKTGFLRSVIRKPKGKTHVPCILLIPGYGCGSIENYHLGYNGTLINEWLKNGYAVITVEKSGMGDSYNCLPCADVDLATDIESFDAGYSYMESLNFADTSNLFIWGHSMGGVIAPEIGKRHRPKGIIVFGTVYRPWSEFLLEMHRIQKPLLDGLDYEQTEDFLRTIQKIYYEFFVLKKSPKELYLNPEYRSLVVSELEYKEGHQSMWGRHWKFWQQLDSLNLSRSWTSLNCPVLVLQGGSDYEQCSALEPLLIEQAVNSIHPGHASRVEIKDLDHFMMKSANYVEARENFRSQAYTKGNFNFKISEECIQWLNRNQKRG